MNRTAIVVFIMLISWGNRSEARLARAGVGQMRRESLVPIREISDAQMIFKLKKLDLKTLRTVQIFVQS